MSEALVKSETKPEPPKSWVQQFVERARGTGHAAAASAPAPGSIASYGKTAAVTAFEYAGGAGVGALLGAVHARWGLDQGAPVDGLLMGLGYAGAVGLHAHFPAAARYFQRLGNSSATVLGFRKGYELVKHTPLPGGGGAPPQVTAGSVQRIAAPKAAPGTGPGIAGEDPIERVARNLG